jgi:hypothetical protein
MALLEGRLDAAASSMHESLTAGQRIEHPYAQGCYAAHRADLHGLRGEPEGISAWFEPASRTRGGPIHWIRATLARAELASGRADTARAIFAELAAARFEDVLPGIRYLRSLTELAHLCADLGDAEAAPRLRELLAPYERHHAVMAAPILYGGPVAFALGRLADVLGRADDAAELYACAQSDCDDLGARPFRARVLLEHGRLRARRGERRVARELLHESAALAQELGMQEVEASARAALERVAP